MVIMLCCLCVTKILFLICQSWDLSKACTEQQFFTAFERVCVYVIAVKSDLNENSCFYNKLALSPLQFFSGSKCPALCWSGWHPWPQLQRQPASLQLFWSLMGKKERVECVPQADIQWE